LRASQGVFDFPIARMDEICAAAHFKGKGFQFVNPLVQAQAFILMHQAGHLTRQQVQDQLPEGMNFEKLVRDLANERDELEAHGLSFGKAEEDGPEADGSERDGAADAPEKSKVQSPRSKGRSLRTANAQVPMGELLAMSRNGH
jgi:capsid protein